MPLQPTLPGAHPLAGTAAEYLWLLPLLPLLGFVLNGLLAIVGAYRPGPSDPSAASDAAHDAHDAPAAATAPAPTGGHGAGEAGGGRARFAGLVSIIGPLVLAASFALALAIFVAMRRAPELATPFVQRYGSWIVAGGLRVDWALQLDQLSMLMVLVVTGVGTLIHLFSVGYMRDDPGYPRYFAYLNLFVAFMLLLVLGANYPLLFIGWEGVGFCSYLLVGFWFTEQQNADAGKKAFVVNRIGDFGFLIAMFLLFANLGTLDFTAVAARAGTLVAGGAVVTAICLFFFLACTGKSAQIPLYVWLPDAMAGPTPVSALIHAATMVTAGVYLIARSSVLFALAPVASLTVAVVGAVTALFAATIALKQWDIKKVLAYSTVSQLGYMFVGVGVGSYVSGLFHLTTHAFFKALLFLGAGAVIHAMHEALHHTGSTADAQDMRNMGGLAPRMRLTWITMWIGTLAIAGIPPFAGFFSKDEILSAVVARSGESLLATTTWLGLPGRGVLYLVYIFGLAAALLTAFYMTRLMLYTFHGPSRTEAGAREHVHEVSWLMTVPLVVLAALSVAGGWLNLPAFASTLGPVGALERWLEPVVGAASLRLAGGTAPEVPLGTELLLVGVAVAIAVAGIAAAALLLRPSRLVPKAQAPPAHGVARVLEHRYYVDEGYDAAIVHPTVAVSRNLLWRGVDQGLIDGVLVNGSAALARGVAWLGSQLQTGLVGTYAWVIVLGVLAVLGAVTLR